MDKLDKLEQTIGEVSKSLNDAIAQRDSWKDSYDRLFKEHRAMITSRNDEIARLRSTINVLGEQLGEAVRALRDARLTAQLPD